MSQQCGKCKWWDRDNKVNHPPKKNHVSDCNAPVPDSCIDSRKFYMRETEGQNCPVYEERKE